MAEVITAVILTLNEAQHIGDCIASVGWADEVIVLDSFSEDGTAELARQAGATVYAAKFENYAAQRNIALGHVQTDWVLFVDADERVTAELAAEIRQVIATRPEAGWYIPRHNYIFGKLTLGAGWYPDYQARLFRTAAVRYDRPVHEVAEVQGELGTLHNPLIHHNYTDPAQFHRKQAKYTAYGAEILRQEGIRPKFYTPYTQPLRHFWWRFVTLAGYKDGLHGLRLSLYLAYYEWEKYKAVSRKP
ncbi:MAG: glycosyltransferase family 2 protein [Chloroflexi bacterium]|nr:glycosyltransferase family 2 protein [Chloroflexota bacterium]